MREDRCWATGSQATCGLCVGDIRIAPFELMLSPYLIVSQTEIPALIVRLLTQPVSVFLSISGEGIALVLIIVLNTEKELNKKFSFVFMLSQRELARG